LQIATSRSSQPNVDGRFSFPEVGYIGHVVNKNGISISTERKQHVAAMQQPTAVSELHAFIGLCNFFRDHIKNFSRLAAQLYKFLKLTNRTVIKWTDADTKFICTPTPPIKLQAVTWYKQSTE